MEVWMFGLNMRDLRTDWGEWDNEMDYLRKHDI